MGWGEPKGPSDEIVRRSELRRSSHALAEAVATFLGARTTANEERMADALARYKATFV